MPNGDYASVIEKLRPGAAEPGKIIHSDGRVLGTHAGIINYTVGQRRGLGIGGLNDPLYVISLNVETREVVVGPKELLKAKKIVVTQVNWLGDQSFLSANEWKLKVKVRSTRPPQNAIVKPKSDGSAKVELLEPEQGIAPGQACVFYDEDSSRVLGGGWINKAE